MKDALRYHPMIGSVAPRWALGWFDECLLNSYLLLVLHHLAEAFISLHSIQPASPTMKLTRRLILAWLTFCSSREVQSKKCGAGDDMAPDAKLRIGVLHRPEVHMI